MGKRMLSFAGLVLLSVSFVFAQVAVRGTVKDETGEGIPGASVQVKGTSQGTITDIDGKFSLAAPNKNSVLVVSFIGYTTVEQKVDAQKPMLIVLKEDTKTLDEVVIVGYQEVRKRDLTGSVAKATWRNC
ncbi:TonB-dependent receptor [Bacteroides pyogenes DSM 20611 = JCM 6294]|uniref:TonB-dependent receptor n=1 Tax=Bacteroides pyogenes DSM 20611 = JCM 6294 TaxID=1121100 RepID=W4PJM7_9BACE|nr:TonB-dependent receptor [Bacteroides pyogenes DSM 20611 = JCM 6294]